MSATITIRTPSRNRGRKALWESRADEIRAKLLAWKQTPEAQRVSLRALAAEIGTSHQLLSFYLRRLGKWQMQEYDKKAQEIYARASAEKRPLTREDEALCRYYERASLDSLYDSAVDVMLRMLNKQIKRGNLSAIQVKMARLLASKGILRAQEILNVHFQRKNNLPGGRTGSAKSFGTDAASAGNSAKGVSRAFP